VQLDFKRSIFGRAVPCLAEGRQRRDCMLRSISAGMNRRQFISLLGGAHASPPPYVRCQSIHTISCFQSCHCHVGALPLALSKQTGGEALRRRRYHTSQMRFVSTVARSQLSLTTKLVMKSSAATSLAVILSLLPSRRVHPDPQGFPPGFSTGLSAVLRQYYALGRHAAAASES
jgi:hypothetical protein